MQILKTLASHIKEYKRDTIATPIIMVLEVIADMVIPLLMASIIDDGVNAGNMRHIIIIGIIMLIVALFGLVTGMLAAKYGSRASAGLAKNLREAMFTNIQTFSFSNIDKFSTASLVTRLTTDVTNVQNAFSMILRMAVRAPFSMLIAMILAFSINARLSMIYVYALLILAVIIFFIMKYATKYFRQAFPQYDLLNESIQENVGGIRAVKAFAREDHEMNVFKRASLRIYAIFVKAERTVCMAMPAMMAAVYACILLMSWFGAKMIVSDELTTGQLMSLLSYCMQILMNLMMLSVIFVMITMSQASAERICEVLGETSDLQNPEDPVREVPDGSIEFKNVMFKYHETSEDPVLDDINLYIPSGSVIGIMGGTGSAKTSLINMISRLYDVNEGEVCVGGIDVRKYDLESLRNQVSVVLQKNELFSGTILDNLRWGDPDATEEECRQACVLACADDFISAMPEGYNTYIQQGGKNVSGGQKQRICIARALLKKPKVLILDDSTSAVDTATDAKIRQALKDHIPETTKIIIAQRISSIENADKVIVMDDGRVNAFDTPENLLKTNEIYREVYASQKSGDADFDEIGGEH